MFLFTLEMWLLWSFLWFHRQKSDFSYHFDLKLLKNWGATEECVTPTGKISCLVFGLITNQFKEAQPNKKRRTQAMLKWRTWATATFPAAQIAKWLSTARSLRPWLPFYYSMSLFWCYQWKWIGWQLIYNKPSLLYGSPQGAYGAHWLVLLPLCLTSSD